MLIALIIAFGYASTMPIGPKSVEKMSVLGIEPSWIGISLLFFLSGILGQRSLSRHGSSVKYLQSRILRNGPLLIVITLLTVLIIFPIFGKPHGSFSDAIKTLALYFFGTITCINPGAPLPGLLDDAKYMCLIQGAIWTLKWGLIAHVAVAAGHLFKIFNQKSIVLGLAILAILTHFTVVLVSNSTAQPVLESLTVATRMAWPFLLGMAVFAHWDKISSSSVKNLGCALLFLGAALIAWRYFPHTPGADMFLTLAWSTVVVTALKLKPQSLSFLNNWSALALAIYLINWPTSQLLLLAFPEIGSWGLIGFSLPVTLVIAWVMHRMIVQRNFDFAERRIFTGQTASSFS